MTTVSVTQRNARLDLFTLMRTWVSRDDAVYPFYASSTAAAGRSSRTPRRARSRWSPPRTPRSRRRCAQLGYQIHPALEIAQRHPRHAGRRQARGARRPASRFDDTKITADDRPGQADRAPSPPGTRSRSPWSATGKPVTVRLTPVTKDGTPAGRDHPRHRLHVPVQGRRSTSRDSIGGPSAGLMFALSIYDTLTPGSLTDGRASPAPARSTAGGKVGRDRRHPAEDRRRPAGRRAAVPGAAGQLRRRPRRRQRRRCAWPRRPPSRTRSPR